MIMSMYYCDKYNISKKDYRRLYGCWNALKQRGYEIDIEAYIVLRGNNKQVRLAKTKDLPKKYYNEKQYLKRALATPKWIDIESIANFYKQTPKGYHVDHIIPLNGKNVSGLHVLWNLQYLPAKDNMKKGNRL